MSNEVNSYQVGGTHYACNEYQHWDWVADTKQAYHIGCATKYVSRWQNKNGIQDLKKACHYLDKAAELRLVAPSKLIGLRVLIAFNRRYAAQLGKWEAYIVRKITSGLYQDARQQIQNKIAKLEGEPTPNYVDPDNNYLKG